MKYRSALAVLAATLPGSCSAGGADPLPKSCPHDDGNDCTVDLCVDGVAQNPPAPMGVICPRNGGAWCDGEAGCHVLMNGSFETGGIAGWQIEQLAPDPTCATLAIVESRVAISSGDALFDEADLRGEPQDGPGLPVAFSASHGRRLAVFFHACPATTRLYQTVALPADARRLTFRAEHRSFAALEPGAQELTVALAASPNEPPIIYRAGASAATAALHGAALAALGGREVRLEVTVRSERGALYAAFDDFRVER